MKKDNGTVHYNVSSKILALQCFLKKFWAMDEFKAVSFIWANRFMFGKFCVSYSGQDVTA